MNTEHQKNYNEMYQKIFGKHIKSNSNNYCSFLLNDIKNNQYFRDIYWARCRRLKEFSDRNNELLTLDRLVQTVGEEYGSKWAGAYSELVAWDFWIENNPQKISTANTFEAENFQESIAYKNCNKTIDLDLEIRFSYNKIYLDTKAFLPTYYEFINHIKKLVKEELSKQGQAIDYFIGIDNHQANFHLTQKHFREKSLHQELINGLVEAIKNKEYNFRHNLQETNYNFVISYKDEEGLLTNVTHKILDPYKYADRYKYKFLNYFNKLLGSEKCFLLLVISDLFNEEIFQLGEERVTFYRSVTRRVFVELTKDHTPATQYVSKLKNPDISVSDIAKRIHGIIFLEDYSFKKNNFASPAENDLLYKSYFYLNPNVINRPIKTKNINPLSYNHPKYFPTIIDDFENDNY